MVMAEEQCTAPGVWMGEGTVCFPNPCPQPPSGSIVLWEFGSDVPEPNLGFVAVAGGDNHSLGLKANGSIVAWGGNNQYGQCDVPAPNTGFVAVAAGTTHSLGLKTDGSIVAWGYNSYGQCDVPAPNIGYVAVAGGASHSLGLKTDGSIVAWGSSSSGQCDVPAPNADFVAVAAGHHHSLGLKANGSIVAWGSNSGGQCDVPAPNIGFVAVAAGTSHGLGLLANGTIVAWGSNSDGQRDVPAPNTGFVAVAAGSNHSLGLKADGSIVAWGDNANGQCNVPEPNNGFVAIAAEAWHGLGLTGPHGACCNPTTGRCTMLTEEQCILPKVWMGVGTPCAPNPCAQPPGGSVYYVRSDGSGESPPYFPTIQAAIDYTDLANGDVIELIGTPFTGPGNRQIDYHGRLVTIRSQSRDPDQCVIGCGGAGGFTFDSGEDNRAVLEAVTLSGGYSEFGGGGIHILSSSPWIKGCKIINFQIDHWGRGAGVHCSASASPLLTDCTISDCTVGSSRYPAGFGGAGIYSDESSILTMRNCIVTGNYVYSNASAIGGGIACYNGDISGCTIDSNHALYGGGIYCAAGVIAGCDIRGNSGGMGAGGVHAGSNTTIRDCVIADNHGDVGGVVGDSLTIAGCAVSGNRGSPGGIRGSNLQVNDCVITGNIGRGIEVASSSIISCTISSNCSDNENGTGGLDGTDTQVSRTILWGNTNPSNPLGHEVIGSNLTMTCCALDRLGASGSITYLGPQVFSDPRFCAPEPCDAPPPGGDYTLLSGSPCLPWNSPCDLLIGALGLGCPATGTEDPMAQVTMGLMPGRPNPFANETAIAFGLAKEAVIDLAIYDVSGRCVRRLASRMPYSAGVHQMIWKRNDDAGRILPSGVYVCRLRMGGEVQSSRLIVLR